MKHRVLGGLTAAVLMSASGVPFSVEAHAAGENQTSQNPVSESSAELSNSVSAENGNAGLISDSTATFPEQTAPAESAFNPALVQDSDLTTIHAHALDNRQAATLFVNSIPVLTLLGGNLATSGDAKGLDGAEDIAPGPDPAVRASSIASTLVDLAADADANDIKVRWDDAQELYIIAWDDHELVAFNQQTMLAGTTDDPAEDALQATNRLRRLLGNAPPLTEIEGRPEQAIEVGLVASTHTGMASWYGPGFHGRRSASGEVFNQHAFTAAHRTLPFGTQVRVTNVHTGQQVVVRINDRGPFGHGRIIDLSAGAAAEIGLRRMGIGRVQLEVLSGQ
jgi:rare lipoprotein A